MNGQQFAEALFQEVYLPALAKNLPEVLPKLSAGVVGTGSEVLGSDDDLSRDHGSGPSLCRLFLGADGMQLHGEKVRRVLSDALPPTFHGMELPEGAAGQIPILTIDRLYADLTGSPHPPRCMREWIKADENSLCYARAGKVIYDPTGELATRRAEFAGSYYPEDLWRWRVASQLWAVWHYGSYNLCNRLARRGDALGGLIAQGHFVEGVMRLTFLLNRQFAPYWKWLPWGFSRLPRLADEITPLLNELQPQSSLAARSEVIGRICKLVLEVLFREGVLPERKWYNFSGAFEVLKGIHDEEVRAAIKEEVPFFFIW